MSALTSNRWKMRTSCLHFVTNFISSRRINASNLCNKCFVLFCFRQFQVHKDVLEHFHSFVDLKPWLFFQNYYLRIKLIRDLFKKWVLFGTRFWRKIECFCKRNQECIVKHTILKLMTHLQKLLSFVKFSLGASFLQRNFIFLFYKMLIW